MPKSLILSALTGAMMLTTVSSVSAAGGDIDIPRQNWSWDGILAPSIVRKPNAASRSTKRFAPAATVSASSPFAI